MVHSALFFLALLLLRFAGAEAVTSIIETGWVELRDFGLLAGVIRDLFVAFLPFSISMLCASFGRPRLGLALELCLFAFFWLLCAGNAAHLFFFGGPLSLKVALSAREVAWDIREVLASLIVRPPFFISAILLILALSLRVLRGPKKQAASFLGRPLYSIAFVGILFLIQQIPVWTHSEVVGSVLSDQPVFVWIHSAQKMFSKGGVGKSLAATSRGGATQDWYAELQEFRSKKWVARSEPPADRKQEGLIPSLRKGMGLDPKRAPNILFVVAESTRALEYFKIPKVGGTLYPELQKRLARRGVTFEQTYTSAKWTIHGLYQLLCGQFDSFEGASVYRVTPYRKEECLPALLKKRGYQTLSMRAYHRFFDGAFIFESQHGFDQFLDNKIFKALDESEAIDSNEWGLADEFFFPKVHEVLKKTVNDSEGREPIFAYILPVGGHAPWRPSSRHPLPRELASQFEGDSQYQGFLNRFKAFDAAVSDFIDRVQNTPELENTVIFIVGDHGTRVLPEDHGLTDLQREFLMARVFGGATAPRMTSTVVSTLPVHQVDFTYLAALLGGIENPPQDWMGTLPVRMTSQLKIEPVVGTPWIDQSPWGVRYVTEDRGCFSEPPGTPYAREKKLRCYQLRPQQDLMVDSPLREIPEDPEQTRMVERFIQANEVRVSAGGSPIREGR